MVKSKFNFKWYDIFMPWGTALISIVIAIMVCSNNENQLKGKLISVLVSVLFLLAIPTWYWLKRKYYEIDYVTKHGLKVCLGDKLNRPKKEDIERLTEFCIVFWADKQLIFPEELKKYNNVITRDQVLNVIKNTRVIFIDKSKIGRFHKFVNGLSLHNGIFITYHERNNIIESIFIHELSHPILGQIVKATGRGKEHHEINKLNKLGH